MNIQISYLEINPLKTFCGIYAIYCLINNKYYIGSTNDWKERKKNHIKELKNNKHHSPHLQNAWNKYGKENFVFLKIEETSLENQYIIEQKYLDTLRPWDDSIGFNIEKNAIKPPIKKGNPFKFIRIDTGEIIEGINIEKYCRENNTNKNSFYQLFKKEILYYKNYIHYDNVDKIKEIQQIKISKKQKANRDLNKIFKFYDKNENLIIVDNLKEFCISHDLDISSMKKLYHGKSRSNYKGYISGKSIEIKNKQTKPKFKFIKDNIDIIIEKDLNNFCRINNLNINSMWRLYHGKRNTPYKGYISAKSTKITEKQRSYK